MAQSAHAYVRGNTVKFYEWLESSNRTKLPEGPPVWICGDCHVGNLGPLADTKGRVSVQIRDLDQTVIGNPGARFDPARPVAGIGRARIGSARRDDGEDSGRTHRRLSGRAVGQLRDRQGQVAPAEVHPGAAGAIDTAPMAAFGRGAARRRQADYSLGQAVLGADARRAQAPWTQMFASDAVRPMLTALRGRAPRMIPSSCSMPPIG